MSKTQRRKEEKKQLKSNLSGCHRALWKEQQYSPTTVLVSLVNSQINSAALGQLNTAFPLKI